MKLNSLDNIFKLKRLFYFLIFINISLILIISLLIYLNTINNQHFNKLIFEIDHTIKTDKTLSADKIKQALQKVDSRKKAYILLKRGYHFSSENAKYKLLQSIAEQLSKKYKKDEKIYKIYLFSLLKNQNPELFFKKLADVKNIDSVIKDFILEGYSSYLIGNHDYEIPLKLINKILGANCFYKIISGNKDIESYTKSFELSNNKNFLNNLILIYLQNNNKNMAMQTAGKRKKSDLLSALVYFDNKEFQKSLDVINSFSVEDDEKLLLQADLEMSMGNYTNAYFIYDAFIYEKPESSSIPYINTIWINYNKDRVINTDLLNKLLSVFAAENIENFLFYLNIISIDPGLADVFLNIDNYLLSQIIINRYTNVDKYIRTLWDIYNNNQTGGKFNQFFAFELFNAGMFEDLNIFILKPENRNKPFKYLFEALLYADNNNFLSAGDNLRKYTGNENDWEIHYNLALIEIINGNYNNAINIYNKIIDIFDKEDITSKKHLSDLYFKKGFCMYKMKKYNLSYKLFNYSLSLDRSNIESLILIKHNKSKLVESQ